MPTDRDATTHPDRPADADQVAGLDALELRTAASDRTFATLAYRFWQGLWPKLLAIAIVVTVWQAAVWSEWKSEFVLPPPLAVWHALIDEVTTSTFWDAVLRTGRRALTGFALAVAIGTVLGVAVARFRPLRAAIGSLITGMQTMPSIMWFPFAILLFQLSENAIMFVVVLGATPSIANGLIGGIDYVPPAWTRVGQVLGLRGLGLYRHLILPAALPSFVSGLKQGWAFAWRSLMAGELLVIVPGALSVGALMQGARELNDAERVLVYIIVVLVIGIIVDMLFNAADKALRRRRGLLPDR